jgi:hypothetical protein
MSTSDEGLRDRINAADRFSLLVCQDYNSKLDALPVTGSEAQEIERLRTVCDDAKKRLDRVKTGGPFVESVDEALTLLSPGASVTVAGNTGPLTVSSADPIPAVEDAIFIEYSGLAEKFTVPLSDIVSVEYVAS